MYWLDFSFVWFTKRWRKCTIPVWLKWLPIFHMKKLCLVEVKWLCQGYSWWQSWILHNIIKSSTWSRFAILIFSPREKSCVLLKWTAWHQQLWSQPVKEFFFCNVKLTHDDGKANMWIRFWYHIWQLDNKKKDHSLHLHYACH